METNIKGLPEGKKYFSEVGYSQTYPWVVVSETAMTKTLAKVNVKRDPEWKPHIIPGGFAGHCDNQHEQTWLFDKIDEARTMTIQMSKKHGDWRHKGVRFLEDVATEFYDYNF